MLKATTVEQEVNYQIGKLHEITIESTLKLSESVINLQLTIKLLAETEKYLKKLQHTQRSIENSYKKIATP